MLFLLVIKIFLKITLADIPMDSPLPRLDTRIIGGEVVDIEEFPFLVSIQYNRKHNCGGSIISKDYILTAAHCIRKDLGVIFCSVRYGSNNNTKGGKLASVAKIIQHPIYTENSHDYDVAVLRLKASLMFNAKCQPVKLPERNLTIQDGTKMLVSGWGVTDIDKEFSNEINAVDVVKINEDICRKSYTHIHKITEVMICAGHNDSRKDACVGDSGGPLILNGVQIGVVSWGTECASPEYPGVYVKVTAVRDWIKKVTGI